MKVNQRDIILIPFPFSDFSSAKVRPALVISNDRYNGQSPDTVVLAMTSRTSASAYKVTVESKDLESGQLPVVSSVRVDKPFSVSQSKVLKVLATVSPAKFEEVKQALETLWK